MDNNKIIEKYIQESNEISNKYNYNPNIRYLLKIIIPAFIIKYSLKREKIILDTFKNTKIYISNKQSPNINAFYTSTPIRENNKIITKKMIVINNFEKQNLIELLDSLVHEFNHAINSYNNEIKITNNLILLRTGLSNIAYDYQTLLYKEKNNSYVLEEIINTKQTEEIIDIIKSFNSPLVNDTIYAINNETDNNYNSKSYYLESSICQKILKNRTFISTLENLRITGNIDDIEDWFDNITGIKNSYQSLINNLKKIIDLESEYLKVKFFKNIKLNQIKKLSQKTLYIIDTFTKNTKY